MIREGFACVAQLLGLTRPQRKVVSPPTLTEVYARTAISPTTLRRFGSNSGRRIARTIPSTLATEIR